ncbi:MULTISPECIES: hypothetical protein [Streptomyces]|uniref:hypothetical protein n=1 Tax=Streptomyces TaxID=1883 RepID=UPI002F95B77D
MPVMMTSSFSTTVSAVAQEFQQHGEAEAAQDHGHGDGHRHGAHGRLDDERAARDAEQDTPYVAQAQALGLRGRGQLPVPRTVARSLSGISDPNNDRITKPANMPQIAPSRDVRH